MKSFFLEQIVISQKQIEDSIQQNGSSLSRKDFETVASTLNFNHIPHAWFIIRETYSRCVARIYFILFRNKNTLCFYMMVFEFST